MFKFFLSRRDPKVSPIGHNALVILSMILFRLWVALTTYPSGVHLLLGWVLLTGYAAIAGPLSLRWRLSNLEPVQVWWNLQLHSYGLALRKNRQAARLMAFFAFWIGLEEICLRVIAIPLYGQLYDENLPRWWLLVGWAIAMLRYPLGYGLLHQSFRKPTLLILAGLLELVCVILYFTSQSFWLTVACHCGYLAISFGGPLSALAAAAEELDQFLAADRSV
jgi:predicted Abi (CAAX) family protease